MRDLLRRHRIAGFIAITYAITWSAWLSIGHVVTAGLRPAYLLGLLGPMLGAVAMTAIVDGTAGLRDLAGRITRVRVGARWWALAIGVPLGLYAAIYVVLAAYSMFLLAPVALPTWASLGRFTGFPVTNAAVLLVLLVAINGFGEETGWRGYLLPELLRRHSPLVASLLVAAVWAPWHLPAFLVSETFHAMPAAMIPMWLLGLAAGSVFLGWLYVRGHASIALVAAFHGTFNLFSGAVGARGAIAAIESTAIVVIAAAIALAEVRPHHERSAPC